MREYEILFVTEINDAVHQNAKDHVKTILQNYHAEIFNEADYGIHNLSYPIRKVNQGKFYYYHFRCDGNNLAHIEKELRYELSILRFIIVRLDEIIQKNKKEVNKENNNNEEASKEA
ncbi:30S ribosomal protein S6 [uncultured Brachyspira sp.]|uniref:30S ribosomal protein S6 n=1 Tax=uncultured Brachyspira sp. TaxID=221953 RepID=UPI002632E32F|nr:30S ribosomal protein S6 [uncultured Brachyspira sp.]